MKSGMDLELSELQSEKKESEIESDVNEENEIIEEDIKLIENERMRLIFESMTDLQKDRYEAFRAAKIPPKKVEKIVQSIIGTNAGITNNILILLGGIAKVYVGELVEEAKLIQMEEGDCGQIKPHQLIESRRRAKVRELLPSASPRNILRKK